MALVPPDSNVTKGDALAWADDVQPGPGTHVEGAHVVAARDGIFRLSDDTARVVPEVRRRARKGEKQGDDELGRSGGGVGGRAGGHRHGLGKHGGLRGKRKKGMGDQGTWD